jgi:hypothetical protein
LKAYLLINTQAGSEPIADTLRAMPGVVSADNLSGPYDAIALVQSRSTRELMDGVLAEVRRVPGVIRALPATLTRSLRNDASGRAAAPQAGARVAAA